MYAVGTNGYSWSSSIAGTNAHNLNFNYSWLNPQNSNNRANGLQLRCLQAFIDASVLASALPLFRFFPVIRMRLSSAGGCTRFAGRMCFESTGGQLPRLHVERSGKFSNLLPLSFLGPLRGAECGGSYSPPEGGKVVGLFGVVSSGRIRLGRPVAGLLATRLSPGLRAYQYGTLYNVGNAGYIWSSTIPTGSGNAHNLNFNYGGINPQNNNNRAYGFQLRCLQAFTAVLPVFYDSVVGANMCEIMKINML